MKLLGASIYILLKVRRFITFHIASDNTIKNQVIHKHILKQVVLFFIQNINLLHTQVALLYLFYTLTNKYETGWLDVFSM